MFTKSTRMCLQVPDAVIIKTGLYIFSTLLLRVIRPFELFIRQKLPLSMCKQPLYRECGSARDHANRGSRKRHANRGCHANRGAAGGYLTGNSKLIPHHLNHCT